MLNTAPPLPSSYPEMIFVACPRREGDFPSNYVEVIPEKQQRGAAKPGKGGGAAAKPRRRRTSSSPGEQLPSFVDPSFVKAAAPDLVALAVFLGAGAAARALSPPLLVHFISGTGDRFSFATMLHVLAVFEAFGAARAFVHATGSVESGHFLNKSLAFSLAHPHLDFM